MSAKTFEQYQKLIADRPKKFSPKDVNFHQAEEGEPMCCACMHWYRSSAGEHDVCEIMRPKNEMVPWNWTCQFNTSDGESFPLLKKQKNPDQRDERNDALA